MYNRLPRRRPGSEPVDEISYGKDQGHHAHKPVDKYSILGGLVGSIIGLILGGKTGNPFGYVIGLIVGGIVGTLAGPRVANYIKKYLQRSRKKEEDWNGPIKKQ